MFLRKWFGLKIDNYFQRSKILNYFLLFYNVPPQVFDRVLNTPQDYMASFIDTNNRNQKLSLLIEEKKQFPNWYDEIYGHAQKTLLPYQHWANS